MLSYPKVPRWDHPVVPEKFYENNEITITEKTDGSNFRFMFYDDSYDYNKEIEQMNCETGDVIFGTRKHIYGPISMDLDQVPGNVRRPVKELRSSLDINSLAEISEGPTVVFAENMVRHTLDYDYNENPPPKLIGFDIYFEKDDPRVFGDEEWESHPYNQRFYGFKNYDTFKHLWNRIFTDDADVAVSRKYTGEERNPEKISIPESAYGSVTAEGLVFRSEDRRFKLVRDDFRELNSQMFGSDFASEISDEISDLNHRNKVKTARVMDNAGNAGALYIVNKYMTRARLNKHIRKLVTDEGKEFGMHLVPDLAERIEEDIWVEEIHEISNLDIIFNPSAVSNYIRDRCSNQLRQMQQNTQLNDEDVEPYELWF